MLCFTDTTTDPYYNLAAEEFLLTGIDRPVFRLWRNAPSVIIGKYQNASAEINEEYVRTHGIAVVRRMTGGGAVFHDLGNVNYTFIDRRIEGEDAAAMFRRFTAPIIEALQNLGVDARLEGRNDLVIDGRKFSGNAVCVHGDRVLQHGTLLLSASMADLSQALNTRPEKFTGKSVQSNRSRVTNISEHLPAERRMGPEEFISYLRERIVSRTGGTIRDYTPSEKAAIEELRRTKYATREWNFGRSPRYGFNQCRKFPCGLIEMSLDVDKGVIISCHIGGDYFFTRPTEEIERLITGLPHNREAIAAALAATNLTPYFGSVTAEDIADLSI